MVSSVPPRQPAPSIHSLLQEAVGMHQAGRMAEAIGIYEQIIARVPNHFDATHLLGVIALQEGRLQQAKDFITSALRTNPRHPAALNNLGMVYLRKADLELAHSQFQRAVKVQPNFCEGLANLGTVLRQLGRPREALVPLRRAYSGNPQSAIICNLIGACLMDTGEPHEAVKFFEAATVAEPDEADGWGNLAIALNNIGDVARAEICADKAVAMRPGSSAALAARGAVEYEQGQIGTAIETYREAIALPDPSTQTYCAFANALWTSGRCDEALDYLRQAVALNGSNAIARWKLTMSQIKPFYSNVAEIEASRQIFAESLENLQTWFRAAPRPEAYRAVGSTQPFYIAYHPFNNRDLLTRYGKLCSEWMASMPIDMPSPRGSQRRGSQIAATERKMRVGIASANIRNHSVWNAVTKGWVQHLDKARFDIWLFHLGRTDDEETALARGQVAQFVDGPKTEQGWAKSISEAQLDALIYPAIGMDHLTTQLASLRLAPVQAATWGHPETTGLPTIDLYLSADAFEPADADCNYSERLVRLPNLGVCVEPLTPSIVMPDLRLLGLPGDEPLLLCPGATFKYSPGHDHVWARIAKGLQGTGNKRGWARIADRLRRKGNGRLVFFRGNNASMDELLAQRLRRAFDIEKVDFDARVLMIPLLDRPRFFGLMQQSALLLDTVGFSGFNNALQAIEAGLPVLAHEGTFMRGRLASGIMQRMNLAELVANTDEAFIEMAVELAGDVSRLSDLRREIANRRKILFHDIEAVRALERCLIDAIERGS
jgi:predicted O-linked N-acetylglucosamine transferase (SPINDLY family)